MTSREDCFPCPPGTISTSDCTPIELFLRVTHLLFSEGHAALFLHSFCVNHFQLQPLVLLSASVKSQLWNFLQTFYPAGFFCESPGQSAVSGPCAAGHFCLSGAVSPTPVDGGTGGKCPQGHYCPVGSSSPEPCPPGRYSNSSQNTKLSDCLPCPPGQCSSFGDFRLPITSFLLICGHFLCRICLFQ